MLQRLLGCLVIVACLFVAGCGSDSKSSGSGSGSPSGGETFTCCINGANFTCPNQAALDKCAVPNLDPSACTHTGDSPDGMCH
jgi:hypothetical protein